MNHLLITKFKILIIYINIHYYTLLYIIIHDVNNGMNDLNKNR